jgi:hypothetical protein
VLEDRGRKHEIEGVVGLRNFCHRGIFTRASGHRVEAEALEVGR